MAANQIIVDFGESDIMQPTSLGLAVTRAPFRGGVMGKLDQRIEKNPDTGEDMRVGGRLFTRRPIPTITVGVETMFEKLEVLPITPRGGPETISEREQRRFNTLKVVHVGAVASITPDELPLRMFGSADGIAAASAKIEEKARLIRRKFDFTFEYLMVSAALGLVKQNDGTTIYDLHNELGIPQKNGSVTPLDTPSLDLDLGTSTVDVRNKATDVMGMMQSALGEDVGSAIGLLEYSLWKKFLANADVKGAWDHQQQFKHVQAWKDYREKGFEYGGITWFPYFNPSVPAAMATAFPDLKTPASMNMTTAALSGGLTFMPTGYGVVFPDVEDLFQWYCAPADSFVSPGGMGEAGQEFYAYNVIRPDYRAIEIHASAAPLPICSRPDAVVQVHSST